MPPIRNIIKLIDRFNKGNLVNTQRSKLMNSRIEDAISIDPKVLFDFFKDKTNITTFPNKPNIANKRTEKSFLRATTLKKLLQATRNQIILL